MENLKITNQESKNQVFVSKFFKNKIIDQVNVTQSFNNCVVNIFKNNNKTVISNSGTVYKVSLELVEKQETYIEKDL